MHISLLIRTWQLFLGESILLEDFYFKWKQWIEIKNVLMMDLLFIKNTAFLDWTCVDYLWIFVIFFSSCLDSHSDGTHSLHRIHRWARDVIQHFSKNLFLRRNKLINILNDLRLSKFLFQNVIVLHHIDNSQATSLNCIRSTFHYGQKSAYSKWHFDWSIIVHVVLYLQI